VPLVSLFLLLFVGGGVEPDLLGKVLEGDPDVLARGDDLGRGQLERDQVGELDAPAPDAGTFGQPVVSAASGGVYNRGIKKKKDGKNNNLQSSAARCEVYRLPENSSITSTIVSPTSLSRASLGEGSTV